MHWSKVRKLSWTFLCPLLLYVLSIVSVHIPFGPGLAGTEGGPGGGG